MPHSYRIDHGEKIAHVQRIGKISLDDLVGSVRTWLRDSEWHPEYGAVIDYTQAMLNHAEAVDVQRHHQLLGDLLRTRLRGRVGVIMPSGMGQALGKLWQTTGGQQIANIQFFRNRHEALEWVRGPR